MKSLSSKTYQCGVTIQGLTTLSGTVYLTGITNTASWDHVIVGTTAQGQIYTRTYAQLMSDITSGIGLSGYVPTSRTLTINGVSYDLTANRSWTITTPYVSKLQHQVKAGVAINKGQAVYVTSADGTNMIVGLASNASEATSSKTMGLLDATVSTNGFANVVTEGLLDGLDTSTAGAAGDPVWLGTGGNLIYGLANKPYAPAHLVFIGIVTRKNSNNGEIFVKVQNGFELNEIHDVDLKTNLPVNGELLGFNGTLWVNKTIAGWLGYTPANASGTTNYISKFTGSTTLGNSQIFDNGTDVGVGTSSPFVKFDVRGEVILLYRPAANAYAIYSAANNSYSWQFGVNNGSDYVIWGGGFTGLGTERFRIASTGEATFSSSVTAGSQLSILGSNGGGKKLYFTGGTTKYNFMIAAQENVDNALEITPSSAAGGSTFSTPAVVINSSGNVGIGTNSPTGKLQIADDGPNALVLGSTQISTIGETNDGGYPGMKIVPYNSNIHIGISSTNDNKINLWYGGNNYTYWQQLSAYSVISNYSTNALVFQVNGGNVGIGTTSPSYKLDVEASSGLIETIRIRNGYTGGSDGSQLLLGNSANFTNAYFRLNGGGNSSQAGAGSLNIGLTESSPMAFYTTNTERMRITSGGNVGIGTTSPAYKLETIGNARISGNLSIGTTYNAFAANIEGTVYVIGASVWVNDGYGYANASSNTGMFPDSSHNISFKSNNSTKVYINAAGNVGIGTTSPSFPLTVYHATNSAATFQTSGTGTGAGNGFYVGHTSNISYVWNYNNFPLVLATNNTERVRVTEGGNVGIGTTAPAIPRGSGFRPMLHVYNNSAGTNPAIVVSAEDSQMAGYIAGDNAGSSDIGWGWNAYYQGSGNNFYNIRIGDNGTWTDRFTIDRYGLVGIGTTTPSTLLDVSGVITATGGNSTNWNTAYGWGNHASASYVPQARTLTINGTSYDLSANRSWTIATTTPGGSDTQVQYNSSGSLAGASALTYNSTTNRVGINQAFPGYDLDVNGQVRVQDKLRVGTGNGVVHMSSTATINASATTVVWAQTVSVGMCAFIEYYILNNNSLTDQRAGTIMVTWNQSGTPTIAHTETTTPDIGSTIAVNFTSSLVGSSATINAVNSSANPYTIVMSYKYF